MKNEIWKGSPMELSRLNCHSKNWLIMKPKSKLVSVYHHHWNSIPQGLKIYITLMNCLDDIFNVFSYCY